MKALLIRYHTHTNTKPSHYTVKAEGCKAESFPSDFEGIAETDLKYAKHIAKEYIRKNFKYTNGNSCELEAGVLPNGDIAVVIAKI